MNKLYLTSKPINAFATTNKGLENLLVSELENLGNVSNIKIATAGVMFTTNYASIMKLNLQSRFSSRILIELANCNYQNEQDIYNMAYDINWQNYFAPNNSIKVKTSAINSPVKSLNFITLKVKDAICDKFVQLSSTRPDVNKNNPDMRIYTFLTKDTATIYLDTSGEGLFKRGYRQNKLEAPLKENLASGLVALSNWNGESTLLDPMCGSGTIIIEALSYALNIAPGLNRNFAFEKINCFNTKTWQTTKATALDKIKLDQKLHLYLNDISKQAIASAKENLEFFKNQLEKLIPNKKPQIEQIFTDIHFSQKNFLELKNIANSGTIICNLPYGVRMEDKSNLQELYPQLAKHLKNNYANWNCYLFTNDLETPKLMRLKPSRKTPIFNGPLECRLFELKMVSGSNR